MPIPTFAPGTVSLMDQLLPLARTATALKRIQSVLLGAKGVTSDAISLVTAYHPQHIRRIWQQYRRYGKEILLKEQRGTGKGRSYLTREQEEIFLRPFLSSAQSGGILIVSEVHKAHKSLLESYNISITLTSTYNLLHRHNWRKIAPRPAHPKGDKEKREEYKALVFPPDNISGKS